MPLHLLQGKLCFGDQRGEAVEVGLPEQLHPSRLHQLLKAFQHIRRPFGALVQQGTAQTQRELELTARAPDLFRQQSVSRQIALVRHPTQNPAIGLGVEVVTTAADVKHPVPREAVWLMYLRIDADLFHGQLQAGVESARRYDSEVSRAGSSRLNRGAFSSASPFRASSSRSTG